MSSLSERNLKLLFARYPNQQQRLTDFLAQASNVNREPTKNIPSNYKLREREDRLKNALLFGFFHKESLKWITSDPELSQINSLYILDNNVDNIKHQLETEDWTGALSNPSFHFLFGYRLEDLESIFYNSFKNPEIAMSYMATLVECHPALSQPEIDFYSQVPEIFKQATIHYTSTLGSIDDYKEGVRATVANTDLLTSCPGIHELKNTTDRPAVLVGAGPSLDQEIERLYENQDKFLIIAADAAVKKLVDAGIRADYCVSIERGNAMQVKFWDGLDKAPPELLPELVAFPVVHEDSFKKFPGNIRIVYRNYAYYSGFEYLNPKGMMHSFSSCMHLGLRLAHWMGSREFILLGCDMCYEEVTPGNYRSHAGGLSYGEWAEAKPIEWFEENMLPTFKPFTVEKTYGGKDVLTHRVYRNFAKQWSMEASDPKFARSIIQCSDSPVMQGIGASTFEYVCAFELPASTSNTVTYKKINKQPPPYYLWFRELKAYGKRFKTLSKLLEDPKKVTEEELQTLHVYLRSICHSEIFCSNWVIQCSTREYYTAWNQINMFDLDVTKDDEGKRANRVTAYINLLTILTTSADSLADAIDQGNQVRS